MSLDRSINAPLAEANTDVLWVWFEGTTAVLKGMGFCYNFDYTGDGAAYVEAARYNRVELPTTTNNMHFAGVAVRSYPAESGGQFIELAAPGSVCEVLILGPSVTAGSQIVTCQAGGTYAGYFTRAGFQGKGSAVPLQTVDASSTAKKCLAVLQEGLQSGLVEVVTSVGGVQTFMVGGCTYITAATSTSDLTFTLANGIAEGTKKKFEGEGSLGTYDCKVTVTSGIQADGATALANVDDLDADNDYIVLQWDGTKWRELNSSGVTKNSS
jgi:hypothetical protein